MSIAKMLKAKTATLTNQQIADFALQEDRAKRAALERGDRAKAEHHECEAVELLRQLK